MQNLSSLLGLEHLLSLGLGLLQPLLLLLCLLGLLLSLLLPDLLLLFLLLLGQLLLLLGSDLLPLGLFVLEPLQLLLLRPALLSPLVDVLPQLKGWVWFNLPRVNNTIWLKF